MNGAVGVGWVVDEGYAEKYGRERRTAAVDLGGFEVRVLHTAEEELPDGRGHHVIAYVKVRGTEMGRKDGWHFGEDGLDERVLQIAGEAVGRAREKLAGVKEAALGVLDGDAGGEAGADFSGPPRDFEVFHYAEAEAEAETGEKGLPVRDANVDGKGEAVACARSLQEEHDLSRRIGRAGGAGSAREIPRRVYYARATRTGACFFGDGRAAPLVRGPVGPTGLGWDPDPLFPPGPGAAFGAREAHLWLRGMRAKVSDHFVDAPGRDRAHVLLSRVEVGGVDLGEELGRHEGDEGLDGAALDLAGRSAEKALEELGALVGVAEEVL